MHSRLIGSIQSNGLAFPKGPKSTSVLFVDMRNEFRGSTTAPLTIVSSKPSSATATLSRIIFMMSGAEHSCSSLGRLSIHAGRSSMNTCAIVGFATGKYQRGEQGHGAVHKEALPIGLSPNLLRVV